MTDTAGRRPQRPVAPDTLLFASGREKTLLRVAARDCAPTHRRRGAERLPAWFDHALICDERAKRTHETDAMIENHDSGNDPLRRNENKNEEPPDAAEIWGRRVGRALGILFALFLVWQLVTTYIIKPA